MSATANNQIMLVRENPASFGYRRLVGQSQVYQDLSVFVKQRGLPNFMAETSNQDRRYFILYYLKQREAFACRTHSASGQSVEFAGPYPITEREFQLLNRFRENSIEISPNR